MTPLHQLGDAIRSVMLAIPLPAVRGLFVLTLVAVLIWVLTLPRSATTPPEGARRWDENLKVGAVFALLLQIVAYLVL
jgi:hypothetical protein